MLKIVRLCSILWILLSQSSCTFLVPVATVTGTTMLVRDERSIGSLIDDNVIVSRIRAAFAKEAFRDIFTRVNVHSSEGRVMLVGSVPNTQYITNIMRITWSVQGVREVINELIVKKDSDSITKNAYLVGNIKTRLLLSTEVKSSNYRIDVSEGVVYVLGIAQNTKERESALESIKSISGVKKIVSHVILKDDKRRSSLGIV